MLPIRLQSPTRLQTRQSGRQRASRRTHSLAQNHPTGDSTGGVNGLRKVQTSAAEERWLNVVQIALCRPVSRPLLGITLRGQTGALRLGVVLLRLRRPCGVSVPPKRSLKAAAKNAAQTSFGPRQESTPWHLGAGPTRLASPSVTRAGYGKSTKRRSPPCTRTTFSSSASSATTQRFAPTTTAALLVSPSQPSPPTRRMASGLSTPNGTNASSSGSSVSSPDRSRKALTSS